MFHLNLSARLRQVAFAAMFGWVAASATLTTEHTSQAQDAPAPSSSLSGYIIAVG